MASRDVAAHNASAVAATTYANQLLRRAEFRAARRRRLTLLAPAVAVAFWALADLVAARHGRLSANDAGAIRHVIDHLQPIAWMVILVVGPVAVALKPGRSRAPAMVAALAGPVLTPLVFGPGGWHAWQIAAFLVIALAAGAAPAETKRG